MKRKLGLVLVATLCVAGIPFAQGNGKGKGNGGGGGGGGGDPAALEIAFNLGGSLALMDAYGENTVVIAQDVGDPYYMEVNWSPDGAQLVFNGWVWGYGIYVVNADGSGLALVAPLEADFMGAPTWSPVPSPDGSYKLVFADELSGGQAVELFAIDPDGSNLVQLTDDWMLFPSEPTWARTGDRFAVRCHELREPFPVDIIVYDVDVVDGELAIVFEQSATVGSPLEGADTVLMPDFAHDSDRLVLTARLPGESADVWVLDLLDPASAYPVFTDNRSQIMPSWSPDDQEIVFLQTGSGPGGIYRVDALGLTDSFRLRRGGRAPQWRP